jgi:hypothetical protein
MNQKAIAEIIKAGEIDGTMTELGRQYMAENLADYFEKELMLLHKTTKIHHLFDRKQFLKDCGVEE